MRLESDYFDKSLPHIVINCVIFGFDEEGLKVLTIRYKNSDIWALPAGLVLKEEDIDFSAHRVLKESTNLQNHYLEQFATFGKKDRLNLKGLEKLMVGVGLPTSEDHFMLQRFIAISYLALVDIQKVTLKHDGYSDDIKWLKIDQVPPLIHDHTDILTTALKYLKRNIYHTPIIQYLLPEYFTMKELQQLYEVILQEKLVRTNFQRWMLNKNILERSEKKYTGKAHKAPYLYKFKK